MKLYAPDYYKHFSCIADRCRHSCCIGWEIDVDAQTMELYRAMHDGYGSQILCSIEQEDTPHFKLLEGERCPHLAQNGLCKIILNCGEDFLCEICREHPRFYNDTANGKEVGVGMACEEACRLILSSDGYGQIREIGSVDGEAEPLDFDVLPIRAHVFEVLSDRTKTYDQRLAALAEEFHAFPGVLSDESWRELLASLEYLDPDHKELFACYTSHPQADEALKLPLERALAYFVYRHCTQAWDPENFSASLGFAMLCERLIASVAASQGVRTVSGLVELARIVSEELEYSEDNTEAIKEAFYGI